MPRDVRCTKANCGGTIEPRILEFGRVVYVCANCERKKARVCRDCGGRTPSPWFWRCRACSKTHRRLRERERDRARYPRRRRSILRRWKRRMQDPDFRARRMVYMADYRRKNPRDRHDRAYGRAYMQRRRQDPVYRARELRRKRELRRQRRIVA